MMDELNSLRRGGNDRFARMMAGAAVLFAALSCFFAYAASPLYRGDLPVLQYHFKQTQEGQQADGRFASQLVVYVMNESSNPARDVFVSVNTYDDPAPRITANTQFTIHDAQPGEKLIKLDLVPANSLAFVTINTQLAAHPAHANPWRNQPWLEAPSILRVYTEHGWVACRHEQCERNFAPTSGLASLSPIKQTGTPPSDPRHATVQQAAAQGMLIDGGRK